MNHTETRKSSSEINYMEGDVFSWGCGLFGRLGNDNDKDVYIPTLIPSFHVNNSIY